ncbi:GNAT family N-acetyltransferase [Nocardioides sp. GY 10113]|uniref:GNAT family N-acetyltransferase n=1 Tax=Nocardioides sp. GY 10113 TaxID=2569761 RepID=UPI0010A8608E|nr:GNAT family N-acetyltransferase [Nocardioides sp. GY 10113]TIC88739.1 GNAT family N-acetyltransferase [Nocardioides sp. GY 10113]
MLITRHGVRTLTSADLGAFVELAERDPVVNVFALHRARTTNLEPRWLGGEVWGRFDGGELVAACHVAANLVPVGADPEAAVAFADRALTRRRTVSTIVGPQEAVRPLWERLAPHWEHPREIRWDQRHMEIARDPEVEPDPAVRLSVRTDLDQLYPACVAMYTEEVGVSPEAGGAADLYRARVAQLVSRGMSFARYDDGELVFKAEVACSTTSAAQIQGVWVPPHRRGEGLASAGMAAVVRYVRARIAPVVSLYVNDWNVSARAAYERVGFVETDQFATVMF